jgi:hypothetical protein
LRGREIRAVQLSVAQFIGVIVTVVVVFGSDLDVLFAVPLGILAGVLTMTLASLPTLVPRVRTALRMRAILRRRPR